MACFKPKMFTECEREKKIHLPKACSIRLDFYSPKMKPRFFFNFWVEM